MEVDLSGGGSDELLNYFFIFCFNLIVLLGLLFVWRLF